MITTRHKDPTTSGTSGGPEVDNVFEMSGPVKWFDEARGYGFVILGQPPRDAFLHLSVLRRDGIDRVIQGDRISCTAVITGKGMTVLSVISVERAIIGYPKNTSAAHFVGKVKFFDQERGYGFVTLDKSPICQSLPTEAFIGSKLLKRLGLAPLRVDQAVKITATPGSEGCLVVETLTFIA